MHPIKEVLAEEPHEAPVKEPEVQEEEVIEDLEEDKVQEPSVEEEHSLKEVMPLIDQV